MAATLAGASRRVLEIPVTTVALSATSLVHLRSAQTGSNIEQSYAFSNASKTIDKDVSTFQSLRSLFEWN